jgi:predicted small secreted protein
MKKFGALLVVVVALGFVVTGCKGESGEGLWKKACEHMTKIGMEEAKKAAGDKFKEPTKEEQEAGIKACVEGMKQAPKPEMADKVATCVLAAKDVAATGKCFEEAAKAEEKPEEKKEEEKKAE